MLGEHWTPGERLLEITPPQPAPPITPLLHMHRTSPRARLFSREQHGIRSLPDMQRVLRLNRYEEDPLSGGNPANAIAARSAMSHEGD